MRNFLIKTFFFIIVLILLYLMFSLITLDLNPLNWLLCSTEFGRFLLIVLITLLGIRAYTAR